MRLPFSFSLAIILSLLGTYPYSIAHATPISTHATNGHFALRIPLTKKASFSMFRLRNPHRILFQFAESRAISRQNQPTLSFSHATIRFLQLSQTETGQRLTLVTTRREEIEIVLTPTEMRLKFPQAP
jgi:hypothetical protein